MKQEISKEIAGFLGCATPTVWLEEAVDRIPELLVDHAQCEKKAASSALRLMFRYPEDEELAKVMSKLAREELRHFEQVLKIMQEKGISDRKQSAARYAAELNSHIAKSEPAHLVDSLIVGAFIEARSCERFARLVPLLDDPLAMFYGGLLESEGRHWHNYLKLAKKRWMESPVGKRISAAKKTSKKRAGQKDREKEFEQRIFWFRGIEQKLIESDDETFRFHSGIPVRSFPVNQ